MTTEKTVEMLEDIKSDVRYACYHHIHGSSVGVPERERNEALDAAIAAVKELVELRETLDTIRKEDERADRIAYLEKERETMRATWLNEMKARKAAEKACKQQSSVFQTAIRALLAEAVEYSESVGRSKEASDPEYW